MKYSRFLSASQLLECLMYQPNGTYNQYLYQTSTLFSIPSEKFSLRAIISIVTCEVFFLNSLVVIQVYNRIGSIEFLSDV